MGFSLPQLWFIFRRVSESPWNPLLLRHSLAQPTSRQISQAYCFMKLASFCSEARAQNTAPFLCSTAQVPEMLTSSQTHSPITSSPLLLFSCIRATLGIPRDSRSWFPHWFWHTTPGKPEERMQGVTFLRLFTINTPFFDLTCDGIVWLGKEFYTENHSLGTLKVFLPLSPNICCP